MIRPVTYTASTQLLIYIRDLQPGSEYVISPRPSDLAQVQNEIEIAKAPGTLTRVIRALNLTDDEEFAPPTTPLLRRLTNWLSRTTDATSDAKRIKVERALENLQKNVVVNRVGTSHTILISVTASYPYKAALIANEIAKIAPQERVDRDPAASRNGLLRERLQGLGPAAYVMSTADPPSRPNGPRKIVIILGAAVLGIGIGAILAILLDFRDRTIRSAEQTQRTGLECIGAVPLLRGRSRPGERGSAGKAVESDDLDSWIIDHPNSLLSQTLRRVGAVIQSSHVRILGVTSPFGGEGARTLAMNIAHSVARSGKNVLFLNAAPATSLLSSERHGSSTGFLEEQRSALGRIVTDSRSGLHVLSSPAPALEDAGSARLAPLMTEISGATSQYDLIVVNLPPLAAAPELRNAAQKFHGLLLVLRWGHDELEQVQRTIELSGIPRSRFIGAVLNMVNGRSIGSYGDKLWAAEAALAARRWPAAFLNAQAARPQLQQTVPV
jgi:Mrp family chromosome partitioning ATPase/capsular polysaccharide biosynthesis protein